MLKIIKNKCRIFLWLLGVVMLYGTTANAALTRLALYGDAKYSENFTHFEYVNPEAPRGGRMVMPEYGSFDNFNPFIFKGSASGIAADLIWDSLGYSPVDDMSVAYPLLAKEFELPENRSYIESDDLVVVNDFKKVVSYSYLPKDFKAYQAKYLHDLEEKKNQDDVYVVMTPDKRLAELFSRLDFKNLFFND